MTRRIRKMTITVAALAALALGGAAFAQAQSAPGAAHERVSKTDPDNVQSGDQKTTDKAHASSADPAAGENPETDPGPESATANDGPGGHADEPGNASADHQFQGNE